MIPDHRTRKWRKVRVVVEVTVPPTSRTTEKDLVYAVEKSLPRRFALPRPTHRDVHESPVRVKMLTRFFPQYLIERKNAK